MNKTIKQEERYEAPCMRLFELRSKSPILTGSYTEDITGTGNGFGEESEG